MDIQQRKFASLWSKHQPAILNMLLAAAYEPQRYNLKEHEFTVLDKEERKSFEFNVVVAKSKVVNSVKDSEAVQDLLNMLLLSRKGSELIQTNSYELIMDKSFILHIQQIN